MAIDFGKLILRETPEAVIVTTIEGEVVRWSDGAHAVFGYTSDEATGHDLAELIAPPAQRQAEQHLLRQTLEHGESAHESMRHTKDGALVYIDSSAKTISVDGSSIDFVLWCKKDVTRQKVAHDAKLAEAKFGAVLEVTPDAILIANAGGRIVLANSQAEKMFGYEQGELRGKPIEVLMPRRYQERHVQLRNHYFSAALPRTMGVGRELFGLRKDGDEFPVEISLSPIDTPDGPLIMSAIRDTTERKAIEHSLHEKNVELEKASQAKDRFLASMSHELRTPLNAIIGFTGTLLMRLPGPVNADQDKQLKTIQSSARHLLSLINDLLDLTKIESGNVDFHPEMMVCQDVIEETVASFRPQVRKKGLQLVIECPGQPLTIRTDRRALQQILMNLINNAIKFTDVGEVAVIVSQYEHEGASRMQFRVRDTGVGIMADSQDKLFQAFSQLDASSTRRYEGTGLGLHLSQKLASLLHGKIVFESQFGQGSQFTLELPAGA